MKSIAWIPCVIFLTGSLLPVAAADAASSSQNALITIEIGRLDDAKKVSPKSYEMLAPLKGSASLLVGTRMPLPEGQPIEGNPLNGDPPPVVDYTYQSVGVTAKLSTTPLDGSRILLKGQVEATIVRNEAEARSGMARPIIGTFKQEIEATFRDGKTKRVAVVREPGTGAFYLEIKVDLVD